MGIDSKEFKEQKKRKIFVAKNMIDMKRIVDHLKGDFRYNFVGQERPYLVSNKNSIRDQQF